MLWMSIGVIICAVGLLLYSNNLLWMFVVIICVVGLLLCGFYLGKNWWYNYTIDHLVKGGRIRVKVTTTTKRYTFENANTNETPDITESNN